MSVKSWISAKQQQLRRAHHEDPAAPNSGFATFRYFLFRNAACSSRLLVIYRRKSPGRELPADNDSVSVFSARSPDQSSERDCWKVPSRKPCADTRSIRTTITAHTIKGKPHRIQWRSASGRAVTDKTVHHFSKETCDYQRKYGESPTQDALTPSRFDVLDSLDGNESFLDLFPTEYIDNSKVSTYGGKSSPCYTQSKAYLTQFVHPSALEVAREGWVFHQLSASRGLEKSFIIATYDQISKKGVLHFYESEHEPHPFHVLDLQTVSAITPTTTAVFSMESLHCLHMSSPIAPPTLLSCASADERDAWVDALTRLCGIEVSKSNSIPPLPNSVVEISRRNNLEAHQLSRDLETSNARIKELEDGDRGQAQIQEAKSLSCGRKDEKEIASYSSVDIHNLIDVKFSQIMEAIWAANTTRANSAEVVKTHATNQEPNATAIENALIDLTESMELRTSRIGKMVHEIASWKEQIMAIPAMSENLATSRSGLDNLAHEVATLLAVAAENSVSDRIMRDEHLKIVKENHSELLKWTEILQKENLIPLTEQIDHIVKTIESVEVAQSKVSGILSKIPQTIKEENRPSEDIVREAEQALDIEPANIRAMSSILLESLANLEGQISRRAREASSKQDLIEIWMNRITDTLKMIQQGIHAVERIERKATAINPDCGKANIASIEIFEGKIESILKNWDKKGTEQFDLAMKDIKETWSKKSARISEDIEDLLKDKAQLSHEISELRKERNGLEEDIAALRRQKDEMGSIAPLSSAVSALERDLEGRIYGLLDEIEILKQTKTELINAN